jgi:hypothetical protein
VGNQQEVATVIPCEALKHILTLVEASAKLKDDTQRKVLLRSVVVVAQKGLGVAPDGVADLLELEYRLNFPRPFCGAAS